MKNIRLTMVQMQSIAGDPERNLFRMKEIVDENDSDIICFPEMCLSGYSTIDPVRIALSPDDPYIQAVHKLAKETGKAIVFGYIEKDGDVMRLRQEFADGSDERKFYRKSHLGTREAELFIPGNELPVFGIKGVCVGLHLCTESHVPEICTTFRKKGAELVLIPFASGISDRRKRVWHSYLPARACDNGMYVAACSMVGDNGTGVKFGGGLIMLDPKGMVIDEYYGDDDHCISADIGGKLPRDGPETMMNISYFDRRRPELYRSQSD